MDVMHCRSSAGGERGGGLGGVGGGGGIIKSVASDYRLQILCLSVC